MGTLQAPLVVVASGLVLLLGLAGVVALSTRRCDCVPEFALLPITWLVIPPGVLIAMQRVTAQPGLVARYWVICLPALAIGVAAALTCPRRGWWLPLLGFLAIALLAAPTHAAIRGPDGHVGQRWVRLAEVMEQQPLEEVPLLISGFSQRGLSANAPDLPPERTPLNGDPGPGGRISPIPYKAGTAQYEDLVAAGGLVLIYQQRPEGGRGVPGAGDFAQTEDVRDTFSEPVVLCQWFGDAVGLFATPEATPDPAWSAQAAATMEGMDPTRIECLPTS